MINTNTVLEARNLSKIFSGSKPFTALNSVSFSVSEGEVVGLLGPNGAGKSTLIQMLLGALRPTDGEIFLFGLPLAENRSEVLQKTGYVNGYGRLPWNLSVHENLIVQGRLFGLGRKELSERIDCLLERFGATELKQKLFYKLSAGEATRVMLIRAFMTRPELVLLDEPTAALDPDVCVEVRSFIRAQQRDEGTTILLTSHNMQEVAELCDRVVFLKAGRIVAEDTPQNLIRSLANSRLRFLKPDPFSSLSRLAGLLELEVADDEDWVELLLPHENVAPLIRRVTEAGISFADLEIRKPTLEDVFIKISEETYHETS